MRNLKKILALALALVMTLSVMSVAGAKKLGEYSDSASVDAKYTTAVDVASQLGILEGDNGFRPKGTLTRAELAAIIYRVTTGDVADEYTNNFVAGASANYSDVSESAWYAGYVGYCSDAGLLEGWDGQFWPSRTLRGYEALAALLRAMGYNQPDEFSGSAWTVRVAQIANDSGVSKGVITDLNQAVTREQTAQFIYNALFADKVRHNAVTYYQPTGSTLAYDVFDVATGKDGVTGNADKWGRPSTVWYDIYGDKAVEITDTAVLTSTVAVDECDIAKALGVDRDTRVESGWIDGDNVPVDDNNTIEALAETKFVGARGRLLEVYDMGRDGVRIVEINTYLAQVTGVRAADTDKNEHPIAATITLSIYEDNPNNSAAGWSTSVRTTGYNRGDWVLVYVNHPAYWNDTNVDGTANTDTSISVAAEDIRVAPVAGTKTLASYNFVSHTFGDGSTYMNADKLELNDNTFGTWRVLTDDTPEKNVIGLVPVGDNYMVIEKIEWKHSTNAVGGYAMADVVLADGTKVSGVTVSSITTLDDSTDTVNVQIPNNADDSYGDPIKGMVSDDYTNNEVTAKGRTDTYNGYYDHIWTYTVNADGSYAIAQVDDGTAAATGSESKDDDTHGGEFSVVDVGTADATYDRTIATIHDDINTVVATDNTVFLYANADGYTYTVYVGADNAPSIKNATMCVLLDRYGYADLVVVSSYSLTASKFLAYALSDRPVVYNNLGTGYYVWKAGETTPTLVYATSTGVWDSGNHLTTEGTGWFEFEVNTQNQIVAMSSSISAFDLYQATDTQAADFSNNLLGSEKIERLAIAAPVVGYSFQAADYAAVNGTSGAATVGSASKDFRVNSDTKVFVVTKGALASSEASIREGSLSDIRTGDVAFIKYAEVTGDNTGIKIYRASAVYVVRLSTAAACRAVHSVTNAVVNIWDDTNYVVTTQYDTGYTTLDAAIANIQTLNKGQADTLKTTLHSDVTDWGVTYAVYTSTAAAARGTGADFGGNFVSTGVDAKLLTTGNVLVLKLDAGTAVTMDDNCSVSTLYVVYQIAN